MRKFREKMRKFCKKMDFKQKTKISRKIQNFLNKFKILAKIHQKRLNFENTRIIFNFQLTLERVKTSDNS